MDAFKSTSVRAFEGQMIKPNELIEIKGIGPLTLVDRRVFNVLLNNAWGKDIVKHQHKFSINATELKDVDQNNQRLRRTLKKLQQTLVVAVQANEDEVVSQLLGSTILKASGELIYTFPSELSELLKNSSVFAKLDLEVMKSFSSKYAFTLYEHISRRINLKHKMMETLDVDDIREMLGVEDGKLAGYRNLRIKAIEPAVEEVNAITPYQVTILPQTKGRKVTHFIMGWSVKDTDGMQRAYKELQQPKVGRRARVDGSTEGVIE